MIRSIALGLAIAATLASSASAADPYGPGSASWTGFYAGVQVGRAWGNSIQSYNNGGFVGATDRFSISGWEGGGTVGYNWQADRLVLGVEADYSRANIDGNTGSTISYGCGVGPACATTVTSYGTLRGRLGLTWSNVLLYGTGGWAFGSVESKLGGGTETNWRNGWTVGAGAEFKLTRNWSAKLEWDHVNFSSFQWTNETNSHYSCAGIHCSTDARFNVVRVGLNYRFDFGSPYASLK